MGSSGLPAPSPGAAGGANAHDLRADRAEPASVADPRSGAAPVWPQQAALEAADGPEHALPAFPRLDAATLAPPAAPEVGPDLRVRPDAPAERPEPLPEWSVVLSDGVALPIYGPVVIGRNPQAAQFPAATVAAIPDPTRTMSKTHARFYVEHGSIMIDDLGSTNGVALFPGGNTQGAMTVVPGHPVEARSGDVVQLGEYEVTVRRN